MKPPARDSKPGSGIESGRMGKLTHKPLCHASNILGAFYYDDNLLERQIQSMSINA